VRVVLYTNVLIAAFATRGLCEDLFRAVLTEHELVVSEFILAEFERVLVDKLRMAKTRARTVADFVRGHAHVVEALEPAAWPENDPDDQWIVATAAAGEAYVLVTGDRDLLDGNRDAPVKILSPREFWEQLRR
jgi:putative PIN family toxin of toxin-antitoxin system